MWGIIVWIGKAIYHAVVWFVKLAAAWGKWAALHPYWAVPISLGFQAAGAYIMQQEWAGARLIGGMLYGLGTVGLAAAFGGLLIEPAKAAAAVGYTVGWWEGFAFWLNLFDHPVRHLAGVGGSW